MTAPLTATWRATERSWLTAEAQALRVRFPPRTVPGRWKTTCQDRETVLARLLAPPFVLNNPQSRRSLRYALVRVLDWLEVQPGRTWQERWNASGADTGGRADPGWRRVPVAWLRETGRVSPQTTSIHGRVGAGFRLLICSDVVRPSLSWLLTTRKLMHLVSEMARARDPDGFAALHTACNSSVVSGVTARGALGRIAFIMAAKGGTVSDITIGDCLELLDKSFEFGQHNTAGKGPYFYQLLHTTGVFPADVPSTVRMLNPEYQGQLTAAQLIDRYDLACRPVRGLLVDYLRERQPQLEYTSLTTLAANLGLVFWKDLERHHPGINSLDLPPEVAAAWKQRIRTKPATASEGDVTGRAPRFNTAGCLHAVRAFYLDVAAWAAEDPARWGRWAVRCPVRPGDIPHRKERGHRKARMDQRTRERLPAIPALAAALDQGRRDAADLLAAARQAGDSEQFTAAGQTMQRLTLPSSDLRVWAKDASGIRRDLIREEDNAFWAWAAVEVLRHTGIRVEELTELSHHSLVQYRLPDSGELIPLLHIAPSKTDEERLLVISPELADALAAILQRIRTPAGTVPLVVTYDRGRVWNPPMPVLFQHRLGMEDRPLTVSVIRVLLRAAFTGTGPSREPVRFTPHDFRRIFATEAMMNGMPPHIAQLLLGHRDINVTMGYKAVYPQEAISGHRAFIARRRQLRPAEEYRAPTEQEWEEFLGHFERRRVALGDCGRAYGTSCIHEHSCIRCPLLRVDPAQRPRLEAIRVNLATRIAEAEREGWRGEAEGLKVSLAAADAKLTQLDVLAARHAATVNLGLPVYRDIAARTATLPQEP